MDGVLVAIKLAFQVVLEKIYAALLVFSKHLIQPPGILQFFLEILLYATLVIFVMKKQHILKKKQEAARRFSAQAEELHEFIENEPCTQANEAATSPPEEARPLSEVITSGSGSTS